MKSSFSTYPFGSPMPNRSFSASSYKYGFNGKEKDDEVKGGGNSVDFGARNYDSRLGRWLSVDSDNERTPDVSPYSYTKCNPIFYYIILYHIIYNMYLIIAQAHLVMFLTVF